MVASATYAPYGHLGDYMRLGFVPVDHDDEAASKTMEYAFDDWTIARTARAMGRTRRRGRFDRRAGNWRNVLRSRHGFVRPRLADGRSATPFDPGRAGGGSGFTEGNAWQYSWYQPQDVGGLIGCWAATTAWSRSSTGCSTRRSSRDSTPRWRTSPA